MGQLETKVVRSVVSPETVKQIFTQRYDAGMPLRCVLHTVGVNDHYVITTPETRYVLCVVNHSIHWVRDGSDYLFELELLSFLRRRGVRVACPVPQRDGALLGRVGAPEGTRCCALFTYADGENVYPPSEQQSYTLGAQVAAFHLAANDFQTRQTRVSFDLNFLLHDPVRRVCAALGDRRKEYQLFLKLLEEELQGSLKHLPTSGDAYGIIGGGFTGTNQHFAADNQITLFGFNFCGYGWRAFDLAVFPWHARLYGATPKVCDAYLAGYQSKRTLLADELEAIPTFIKAKMIFTMGYHTTLATWIGERFIDDAYWDRHMIPLRSW